MRAGEGGRGRSRAFIKGRCFALRYILVCVSFLCSDVDHTSSWPSSTISRPEKPSRCFAATCTRAFSSGTDTVNEINRRRISRNSQNPVSSFLGRFFFLFVHGVRSCIADVVLPSYFGHERVLVFCVVAATLQGHGRDVGRLAAHVVQEFMQDWLTRRWEEVKENPAEAFRTLFREVSLLAVLLFVVVVVAAAVNHVNFPIPPLQHIHLSVCVNTIQMM